jgi:hypothetical protein
MGVTSLPQTQALQPGADLWVVGDPKDSRWALKIDWELNFQILRAGVHERPRLSPELVEITAHSGLEAPHIESRSRALLLAADLNLPCRWVLSLADWKTATIAKAREDLKSPSLRVFLPKTQSVETFTKEWSQIASPGDFQVVVD